MRVLVLGGTGAMGVHLVRLLSERHIEIIVTSRQKVISPAGVRYVQGDAQDISFLRPLLEERWDAVVDFMIYTSANFNDRVGELLDSATQYVFISSARVYADSERPIVEQSERLLDNSMDKEFLATDEYSLSKARQEDILKGSGRSNWTIIRPYITYDNRRLQLGVLEKEEWLYRATHGRTIVFSRDILERVTTLTSGFDVARGILSLIGNSKALGEAFHITCQDPIGWQDVLKIYTSELGIYLGREPKIALLSMGEFLESKPAKYQICFDRLYNRRFDCTKISTLVNVQEFMAPEEGLRLCLREFLRDPKFGNIDWKHEAIRDRQTKQRARMREIGGFSQKLGYIGHRYFWRFMNRG